MTAQTILVHQRRTDILARNVRTIEESGRYDDLENQIVSPE